LHKHPVGLCAIILMASSLPAAQIRLEAKEFIEVQADGKHCAIRKVRILCTDAIAHLQETLKLPAGTAVGVKAHQAAPYKEVKKVLDDVRMSGFVHPVAHVREAGDTPGK
jgi:biopolymer transport protein ExbD